MWIYWKEECRYCVNQSNCEYKRQMINFKTALAYMEKSVKGIYGTLKFNCDYFVVDEEEYRKDHVGDCEG